MSSQASASPARQRRTSTATTWTSSNPHSLELLVTGRLGTDTRRPQHHNRDTLLWCQKFNLNFEARNCIRAGEASSEKKANTLAPLFQLWPDLLKRAELRAFADE